MSIILPVWKIPPASDEPEETLMFWTVREIRFDDSTERTRHLVGCIRREIYLGRATSAIKEFDRDAMRVRTRSGRIYNLEGSPCRNPDAEFVWSYWKTTNRAVDEVDVSSEYLPRFLREGVKYVAGE